MLTRLFKVLAIWNWSFNESMTIDRPSRRAQVQTWAFPFIWAFLVCQCWSVINLRKYFSPKPSHCIAQAEVCRSTEFAMKRCPNGMFAEIKYDGERVQIHKNASKFHFFSRSLKPVQRHKVSFLFFPEIKTWKVLCFQIEFFEKFIPQAFPGGENLIIDAEVLLIDNESGNPLPFGTLGVHKVGFWQQSFVTLPNFNCIQIIKKTAFHNANVCLFVFDCLLYQNESLMHK